MTLRRCSRTARVPRWRSRPRGPAEGLALLEHGGIDAEAHPYVHLVRGTLLGELGRVEAATRSLEAAAQRS